jgi:hypothetical protein
MKPLALIAVYSVAAYALSVAADTLWVGRVLTEVTFHRYFGFIDTMQIASWVPTIALYGALGLFTARLLGTTEFKWVLVFSGVVLMLELLLVTHHFTEYADGVDRVWGWLSYLPPSISLIAGHQVGRWLTRHSKPTPQSGAV